MNTVKTLAACALLAPLTLGATSVYAQERAPDQTRAQAQDARKAQGMQQPGPTEGQAARAERTRQAASKAPLTRAPENTFHVDWLMGKDVHAQGADDSIGTIEDLLVGEDGRIVAVIVGVGGVLGMGEKSVAIPWDAIHHTRDQEGDTHFTTDMTLATLENVPEYDRDAN
jgi:sporulation protein YlmC with PRC-barrel domain